MSPARTIQNSNISLSYISTGAKENTPNHKVCDTDTYAKGYVQMDSDKIRKVTYEFDKPIKSVEIYLQKFGVGYSGSTLIDKSYL